MKLLLLAFLFAGFSLSAYADTAVTAKLNSRVICSGYAGDPNASWESQCQQDAALGSELSNGSAKITINCRHMTDQEASANGVNNIACGMEEGSTTVLK